MKRMLVAVACFAGGLLAGALMALAWGWITIARSHSGIDYPELDRLTRIACIGAAIEGATAYIAGLSLLSRGFAVGWALGLIPRFALAFVPTDRMTNAQYWMAFLLAWLVPPLSGLIVHRTR